MKQETPSNRSIKEVDGQLHIFYDGYWIKYYKPPAESLEAKKLLIEALTRRLFNHVEHGINIPGRRLREARKAYQAENDPDRKRIKGAMLAGALFNRAASIFTKLVDLQAEGVELEPDDALMEECGNFLLEAMELGHMVRHRGGDEGIDELWGEPFKAFSQPIANFYDARYIKIALTMRDIDRLAGTLKTTFAGSRQMPDIGPLIDNLTRAAKSKCETLRTDTEIFEVWPDFVVASERLRDILPTLSAAPSMEEIHEAQEGARILKGCTELITHIVRARVPMPKSTRDMIDQCHRFRGSYFKDQYG